MNIEEIKQRHEALIQERIDRYISKIDSIMIYNYEKIKNENQLIIEEEQVCSGYDFDRQLKKYIILK